ncbi:LacI family transcriptional regulator [Streptosporangium becharense]|uniref:LacI family transcriptional regulator n=1 Tax=Streptosporangium becharense TaxID=1816182 RepID=A0A7W9ILR8_9ACTN|nr:LacI family DNA-binding transcriptional regulator [Streptosporangium becharense]MBB2910356.1 LacI family transcriptional regulator [Streptosporangium becharense]MBB5823099.1 LacI family transcriptional regulator [Streptosporangium becharense]
MRNRPATSVTIADVARAAGVSTATAARALGGYGTVRRDTLERVTAAASELGYRPNALARSMITGRTQTIGVIVADIENPFFARVTRAITDVARASGFEVVLANSDEDLEAERAAVKLFLDKRVDGLIVAAASNDDGAHLAEARATGAHVVLVDRRVRGTDFDTVLVHNRAAARDAVRHLVAAGHRRIGYVSGAMAVRREGGATAGRPRAISTGGDRLTGYRQALKEAGLAGDLAGDYVRVGGPRRQDAFVQTMSLLELGTPPTAILATDSVIALGVIQAVRAAGRRIPDDVSLISFDDTEWAEVLNPPLTVIAQPVYELGARATTLLINRLQGDTAEPRHVRLTSTLVERGSVAVRP